MLKRLGEKLFHKTELKELRILNKKLSNQLRIKANKLECCERSMRKRNRREK